MKIFIVFSLSLFIFSCSSDYVEIINGEKPFKGEKNEAIFAQKGDVTIKEKKTSFLESNFYHTDGNNDIFLINYCRTDCNEKIEVFSIDGNAFSFLIKKSNRFRNNNRLILFVLKNDLPNVVFDSQEDVYKTFRFEDNKFIYTLENGSEKTINLN